MSDKKAHEKNSELEKLEKKCQEYLAGWQRSKADYQNLQKQVAKEREEFARFAKMNWVIALLPLYNNLQTAFKHLPDNLKNDEWVHGILHIKDQFSSLLKDLKVDKIKTRSEKFNAEIHEAVAQEVNKEHESGMIIREVEPGYSVDGRVLVAAKVVVAE
jgi:molecular chaperone GrpE